MHRLAGIRGIQLAPRHGPLSREGLFRRRGGVHEGAESQERRCRAATTCQQRPRRRLLRSSNRQLDQLWAAFEAASVVADAGGGWFEVDFDASYLLDVQLSDSQLEEYLERYANAPAVRLQEVSGKAAARGLVTFTRSSLEAVRYELAVRHARREEYADAATLLDRLQSPRASRMRRAETPARGHHRSGGGSHTTRAQSRRAGALLSTAESARSASVARRRSRAADIRLSEWLARGR